MKQSQDPKVQQFLDELQEFAPQQYEIVQTARKIVFGQNAEVTERIMYGGIMFTKDDDFGGIFAYEHHVSFEFTKGYTFADDDKLLEGNGKYRRHLKLKSLADVEEKNLTYYIQQALQ
jgi:hypothetical protein